MQKKTCVQRKIYQGCHRVSPNARYLPTAFVNTDFDFHGRILSGAEQIEPRWKRCTQDVDDDLGEALGQAYVDKYFSSESKMQALKMVKEIEIAMAQDINALPWMSATTKPKAIEKLHAVANKIGYPDKWRDYNNLTTRPGGATGHLLRA